jgi:hypothetical protein
MLCATVAWECALGARRLASTRRNVMKGKVWCAIAALALVVTLAVADDPWKGTAYDKWDGKDVEKILKSSPWGREIVTKSTEMSSENRQKVANSTVNKYDRPEQLASEWVQVVWWSSKTLRRAVLRRAMLQGIKFDPESAKQFAEGTMDDHVIVVWGDPKTLAGLARLEPAELKKIAYLESPRLKVHIDPIDAAPVTEGNTPPDKIRFHFPRKLNGADTVTAEDSRLIFKWRLVRNPKAKLEDAQMFEVVFSPNKMISGGAADY